MNRFVISSTLLATLGVAMLPAFAVPAAAYDPLCNKISKPLDRERCKCSSDAGGLVFERPNEQGKTAVYWNRPSTRRTPELHACMTKKGITPG